MEMTLNEMLAIVESDFLKEVWRAVAVVSLHLALFFGFILLFKVCGALRHLGAFYRQHPFAIALSIPLIVFGATKIAVLVPAQEQCDYRVGEEVDVTDGWLGYVRMTGDTMPTNIQVACCGKAVTNELTFTHTGQFYIETDQYASIDLSINPFWVRDSETNDWTKATADIYLSEVTGATVVQGWSGEIAHLPDYGDPKAYRYWFIGAEENLPEKIIEGGVGIVTDFYYRDAHHILLRFHTDDPELRGATFVLQVRTVGVEGELGDWQTIATTTTGEFNVAGNFVQTYNRLRIYADKEGAE